MRSLMPRDLLEIYELASDQQPSKPVAALLAAVSPEAPREELDALSLGRGTARLVALFSHLFGPILELHSACPACHEGVDFRVDCGLLLAQTPISDDDGRLREHVAGELSLRFRLLTGADLAAAGRLAAGEGRRRLVERCLVEARRDGEPESLENLSEQEISELSAALEACDPLAEVRFDLICPACKQAWQARLDAAACLSQALSIRARRLLAEVHTLGCGYGWREADILAMSAQRRRTYVEMLEP